MQASGTFTGAATAAVSDSTPAITGIDPSDWTAGSTASVTFIGQNFGTNAPTLSFSPSSGIGYTLSAYSDTQIIANVTVASGTPTESVSVTVTSNGYNSNGLQSGGNGQSAQSQPATASVRGPMRTTEITVISWLDETAFTLPTGEGAYLQSDLNNTFYCVYDLSDWMVGIPNDLITAADRAYANVWLLQNSANSQPPSQITPSAYFQSGNFRLINDLALRLAFMPSVIRRTHASQV